MSYRKSTLVSMLTFAFMFSSVIATENTAFAYSKASTAKEERLKWYRRTLEKNGVEVTSKGLISGLIHEDAYVRSASLSALAIIGDMSSVDAMRNLLSDPDMRVRRSAINAINVIVTQALHKASKKLYKEAKSKPHWRSEVFESLLSLPQNGRTGHP